MSQSRSAPPLSSCAGCNPQGAHRSCSQNKKSVQAIPTIPAGYVVLLPSIQRGDLALHSAQQVKAKGREDKSGYDEAAAREPPELEDLLAVSSLGTTVKGKHAILLTSHVEAIRSDVLVWLLGRVRRGSGRAGIKMVRLRAQARTVKGEERSRDLWDAPCVLGKGNIAGAGAGQSNVETSIPRPWEGGRVSGLDGRAKRQRKAIGWTDRYVAITHTGPQEDACGAWLPVTAPLPGSAETAEWRRTGRAAVA